MTLMAAMPGFQPNDSKTADMEPPSTKPPPSPPNSIGPEIPTHLLQFFSSSPDDDNDHESGLSVLAPTPSTSTAGPHIPNRLLKANVEENDEENEDNYVPALSPDLLTNTSTSSMGPTMTKRVSGASFPPSSSSISNPRQYDEDKDEDSFGPQSLPSFIPASSKETGGVKQFFELEEKRKNAEEAAKPKVAKRDEWMLVPPSAGNVLSNIDQPA